MTFDRASVLVLMSGGVDSAACARFYQREGYAVSALFIDYGQPSRDHEWRAVQAICSILAIELSRLEITGLPQLMGKIVGRNSTLLSLALMAVPRHVGLIAIGIHAGTMYEDCSSEFLKLMQELADLYTSGQVLITAPFIQWTKRRIWEFALQNSVPIDQTFSCENGGDGPCGTCLSCRDMGALYAST